MRFAFENPEHSRILFRTRRAGPPGELAGDLPGPTAFSHLVEEVAGCMEGAASCSMELPPPMADLKSH